MFLLKIRSILFLLVFLPFGLYSQGIFKEGYIVRNTGIYIEGLVEFHPEKKIQSVCVFKRFEIAGEVFCKPTEIKAYGFKNGMRYESLNINGKTSFYETLVQGDINLFKGKEGYVVQKTGKDPVLIKRGKIIVSDGYINEEYTGPEEFLRHLTADSGIEIMKDPDLEKDLLPLILSHNQKSSLSYKNYAKLLTQKAGHEKLTWMATMKRNSLGISAGVSIYDLKLSPETNIYIPESDRVINPIYGLNLESIISRRNDRLSFSTGLYWMKHSFYSYSETPTEIGNLVRNDAFFSFSAVKIPLLIRYSLGGINLIPYLNGGFTGVLLLKKDYHHISETETSDNIVYTSEDSDMIFKNLELGISVGAGVKIRLNKDMFIIVESRIESGNGIFDMKHPRQDSFKQHSFQPIMLLGLQF